MPMASDNEVIAKTLADSLPVCDTDDEEGGDLISLCDIVITGMETGMYHWRTRFYNHIASGTDDDEWAIVSALGSGDADPPNKTIKLTATTVRKAVQDWLVRRLDGGMPFADAQKMIDGTYTDAVVADAIIQVALYGEEVYGG